MEKSNIKDFIDTYCSIPPETKSSIIPATVKIIITNHHIFYRKYDDFADFLKL